MGDAWRGSKATDWGGEGVGGGIPLTHEEDFAFWGLKVSDLVHTLGEFVGILYSISINWKINTLS